MEGWKTIEPNLWKPEQPGDSITGVLLVKQPKDKEKDWSALYTLETENGIFKVWGSTILDDRMELVKVGEKVRITFKEKKENKNKKMNPIKIFKVEVAAPVQEEKV